MLVLATVEAADTDADLLWTAQKLTTLRIFQNGDKAFDVDVKQIAGSILLVSNFTVAAETAKGRRPGFSAAAPPEQALQSLMRAYLSKEHGESAEMGCPVAALGSEMPRQAPDVRRAATRRIKEMIDVVARQSPDWGQPGAHEHALVTTATMVGALLLARAVDEPKLSDALREAALKHLVPTGT
jgi:D-tyrosyl-tRNA(Tyr) deacylase